MSAASIARSISSLLRYLPVPMINRDRNSRPAIVSGVSCTFISIVVLIAPPFRPAGSLPHPHPFGRSRAARRPGSSTASSAAHEVDQLERIARKDLGLVVESSVQNFTIVLHHDHPRMQLEIGQELADRPARADLALLAVQHDPDRLYRLAHTAASKGSRYRSTARTASSAAQTPL